MRDWNLAPFSSGRGFHHCFQHTYEGLKPWNVQVAIFGTVGFQHTYEGLKLGTFSLSVFGGALGFQHTYEGLKLVKYNNFNTPFACFQHTYEGLKPTTSLGRFCWIGAFSAYLWGIETFANSLRRYNFSRGFQHTYEGLKPCTAEMAPPLKWVFSIPMRDWNSVAWPFPEIAVSKVFSIPMRDWNLKT